MVKSTFKFALRLPRRLSLGAGRDVGREEFFEWVWASFGSSGLVGIHEGTVLSEEAAKNSIETDSWAVDSGLAPRSRDWIADRETGAAELYFDGREAAERARAELRGQLELEPGEVEEVKPQDWDAEWKAAFLNSGQGVRIAPCWWILPPWAGDEKRPRAGERILKINPGAGFGTGTHETTQLCLGALGRAASGGLEGREVLDFGSGSGILSVAAALLGASAHAVEIDPLAIENARENARINGVAERIAYSERLPALRAYDVVIANILKPVLLEFADKLVPRLKEQGALILSGLIEKDIAPVRARYGALLGGLEPEVLAEGEWRALVWKR